LICYGCVLATTSRHSQSIYFPPEKRWRDCVIVNGCQRAAGKGFSSQRFRRDAPELARNNPQLTIVTIDPPRTSILFRCVPGARYLNLHTREFGLGGGSLSCPQAQNIAMGGLHITLPMRADAQDRIIDYLHQDEVVDTELAYAPALPIESTPLPPLSGDASLQKSSVTFGRDRDCISIPQGDAICLRKLP
jgi:hypothetical protein